MGSLANIVTVAAVLAALVVGGECGPKKYPPGPNITCSYNGKWLPARATWYGKPTGAGPDDNGGACGIKDVNLPPYSGMTACGNVPIFKDGKGCGSCYEVRAFHSFLAHCICIAYSRVCTASTHTGAQGGS
jgi:hypothetical protein